ncbi:MAG: hypothetical protein WBD81_19480 [Collimonas pratensis]|uniref:hypothetical protein n=1 Tax=Collimonas pratensis TaxID=279113 RepID=UPI003C75A44C
MMNAYLISTAPAVERIRAPSMAPPAPAWQERLLWFWMFYAGSLVSFFALITAVRGLLALV